MDQEFLNSTKYAFPTFNNLFLLLDKEAAFIELYYFC